MRIIYEIWQLQLLCARLIFPVENILMIEAPQHVPLPSTSYRTLAAVSLSMIFIIEHDSTLPFTVFLLPSCRFDLRFFLSFFKLFYKLHSALMEKQVWTTIMPWWSSFIWKTFEGIWGDLEEATCEGSLWPEQTCSKCHLYRQHYH